MSQTQTDLMRDGVAYVDQWLAYQQQRREVPGIVVAIRWQDQLLLSRGYGYANLEQHIPMTPQHLFRIASHSKMFTATAILQLVEQGTLRLDDRLASSVPWLAQLPGLDQVTLRQVLNHSAGIVRDGRDADYSQLARACPDEAALRAIVEDQGAVLPANERFKYSNTGYALLGLVIARASGLSYHAYVQRHILDPLGLRDTGPETDAYTRSRLATGYTARRFFAPRRPLPDMSTQALAPAAGFYATAEDLCRFAAAQFLGSGELLRDASKREMQQPYWHVEGTDLHYGLGFDVTDLGSRRLIGHGGGFPGFTTHTLFDPQERLVVVVLTNEIGDAAHALAPTVVRLLDYALAQPPTAHPAAPSLSDRYGGRFASLLFVTDVVALGETLVALNPDADDPLQSITRLAIEDPDTLRITATNGLGSPGEAFRSTRDDTGRVLQVVMGGVSAYPLDIARAESAVTARTGLQ